MNWIAKRALQYAYQRAMEASTWRNLILLVGGTWAATHPDLVTALLPFCVAAAGLLGAALPDLLGATRLIGAAEETCPHDALPPIALMARSQPDAADVGVQSGPVDVQTDAQSQSGRSESSESSGWNGYHRGRELRKDVPVNEDVTKRRDYRNDEGLSLVVERLEHQNDLVREDVRTLDQRLRDHADEEREMWAALQARFDRIETELETIRPASKLFHRISGAGWVMIGGFNGVILFAGLLGAWEVIKKWLP